MLTLTVLGNNSAIPAFGRNPTAQFLQSDQHGFLIDCGEGTQNQISRYKVKPGKISHILISHLHGDHYFGLIGLLTSMSLLNRQQEIHLYGPRQLIDIIQLQLQVAESELNFELHFHPLISEGVIMESDTMMVHTFKVNHRIACWGFVFSEKRNKRKILADKAQSYGIPNTFYEKLQQGQDYQHPKGTIVLNEEVTESLGRSARYAYCADTLFDRSLLQHIKGVDLLYHETTYLKDHADKAALRYHSTTHQAATIAKEAGVAKLMIGHFSSKYESILPFLEETVEVFEDTILAIEGSCIKI